MIRCSLLLAAGASALLFVATAAASQCPPLAASTSEPPPSEQALLDQVATAVACEYEQPTRDFAKIAAIVDGYLESSAEPSCQLLKMGAEAHIAVARTLGRRGLNRVRDREAQWHHWRQAWDLLNGISLAWQSEEHTGATDEQLARARCLQPARQLLSGFPSVTIAVSPEDATGYQVVWNHEARTLNLPLILPGTHQLAVTPPSGKAARIRIDGGAPRTATEESVQYLPIGWMDRITIDIEFVDPELPTVAPTTGPTLETPEGSPSPTAWLPWAAGGTALVGVLGMATSGLLKGHYEGRGEKLATRDLARTCEMEPGPCPWDDDYDRANAWGVTGVAAFGTVTAVGAAGLLYHYFWGEGSARSGVSGVAVRPSTESGLEIAVGGHF